LLIAAAGLVVLHPPADPPAGAGAGAAAGAGEGSTGMPVVTIAGGDTLWEIARSVRPRRDPRVEVAQIIRVNGLPGPVVHVGQRLRVP
jgi:LysM repeat protein